jgi:hypothetical protein
MTGSRFSDYLANRSFGAAPSDSPLDKPIGLTFFQNFAASAKTEETMSLRALMERLKTTHASSKDALPWLKLAKFGDHRSGGGSFRNNANVQQVNGIEVDYDGEQITPDRARTILTNASVAAIFYTSPSHTPATPRWRLLMPLSQPIAPDERANMVARINGLFVGALSRESFTLSHSYYFGFVDGAADHLVFAIEGRALDLCGDLDSNLTFPTAPPAPLERPTAPSHTPMAHRPHTPDGGTHYGVAALDSECDAIRRAWDGSKHHTLNKAAFSIGGLVAAGELQEGFAFTELSAALADIRHACKDFRHAQNTLRTAFQDGMRQPRDVPERPPIIPDDAPHPAAAFLAKVFARSAEKQKAPLPVTADLMDVPGALKLFIDHCEATAISPQPFLALAAGITLIGTLAGRRYRTTTDLRTNIYAIGIADSGAGKDHARRVIKKCLTAADLSQYLGGSDIASGSGLRTALLRHPAMLFQIDEFGDWLTGIVSDKAGSHRKQIAAMLKELYSSASGPWQGTEYADQSKMGRPREDIHDPHACFYGTTTPGQFWNAIAGASLHDGLMARMLLFVSPCSYPDEQDPALVDPPPALIDALQAIARGAGTGNLSDLMMADMPGTVTTVAETPEASDARRAMRQDQLTQQREAEGTYVTAIAGRLAENAMKLALIRAVSRDPGKPVIDVSDVAWGRALAQHCVDTLLRDAGRHVGDTEFEKKMNLAADIIRKHGPIGASEMIGKGFRFSAKERSEIIETLLTGGIISPAPTTHKGPGRPSVKYVIAG